MHNTYNLNNKIFSDIGYAALKLKRSTQNASDVNT